MLARMATSARLLPLWWWAAYAALAAAMVAAGLLWDPGAFVYGPGLLIGNLLLRLAGPARPPTWHRSEAPGTEHLGE